MPGWGVRRFRRRHLSMAFERLRPPAGRRSPWGGGALRRPRRRTSFGWCLKTNEDKRINTTFFMAKRNQKCDKLINK